MRVFGTGIITFEQVERLLHQVLHSWVMTFEKKGHADGVQKSGDGSRRVPWRDGEDGVASTEYPQNSGQVRKRVYGNGWTESPKAIATLTGMGKDANHRGRDVELVRRPAELVANEFHAAVNSGASVSPGYGHEGSVIFRENKESMVWTVDRVVVDEFGNAERAIEGWQLKGGRPQSLVGRDSRDLSTFWHCCK